MDYARRLASFCSRVTLEEIPEEVLEKARLCVLDFVANLYGSLGLEAVSAVVSYVRSLGETGIATALGCGFRTGLHSAAFLNGVGAEALEAQDGLRFGGNHPGTAVIPAAFAVAEQLGLGGARFLEAVVAGYEAADRIASAVHPHHTLAGFLPTGTCGTFGAACAAARLMDLDEEKTLHTLGNAGYLLPLSMGEHLMGGFTVKIAQGGQAASAGITAAGLAREGITGAPYVLEGSALNGGFARITTGGGEPDLGRITEGLGERYTLADLYFKPYTACRHTHGAAQATLELRREHAPADEEIEGIEVFTYGIAALAVGKGFSGRETFVTAQFSLPYVVAACLLDGELGPRQLTEERLRDPRLARLAGKVQVHVDEALDRVYPEKTSTRVEIRLAGGRTLARQIDIPKGDPRDPLGADELTAKLKGYAPPEKEEGLERVVAMILELERVPDVRELTDLI